MTESIILGTWSFGKKANAAGWPYLSGPQPSSLDAVEQACRAIEADPEVLSVGYGGCPDRSGEVSLDASIMLSPSRCGAVSYVRRFPHPVSIARLVMDRLNQGMLAGEGADLFAARQGFSVANLLTGRARTMWLNWVARYPTAQYLDDAVCLPPANLEECGALPEGESLPHNQFHDTVGVLAMDSSGRMAGACSTSGLPFKVPGRVGDSPIIGHGLYVDPRRGAAVATGTGELIMGVCGSFLAVDLMGRGVEPKEAAREVLQRIIEAFPVVEGHQAAIVTLSPSGQWSAASLRPGYFTAVRTPTRDELVAPECVLCPRE